MPAVSSILAGVALVGTAGSLVSQRQAGKDQQKSQKIAQRQADFTAARGRRAQVRQERIRRAEILSASANTGAAGSSSETGAVSSLQSQTASNLGASFQNQAFSQQQTSANRSAAKAGSNAATFGAIGNLASTFVDPKQLFKT